MSLNRRSFSALATVVSVALLGACSSSTASKSNDASTTSRAVTGTPAKFVRPGCTTARGLAPKSAAADPAKPAETDITSFDGTIIRAHWFPNPSATKATVMPTVMKGPGWSQPGDVNTASKGDGIFGDLNIANLWTEGYNVLTWDPRGFGKSGGEIGRAHV